MSNSTSIFSRLKLRSKLLLLAALPLAALLVTAGLLIASAQQDRSEALNEQAEIDRVTAAAALADSLAREQDSYLRSNTIQSTISVAQLITDEALEAYGSIIDGSVGEVTELDELRTDLELVRSELTGADQIREMQQMALARQLLSAGIVKRRR